MTSMVMGWASGRFGLFGLTAQSVSNPTLNTVGVLIAVLALGVFAFVKPDVGDSKASKASAAGKKGEIDEEDPYGASLYAGAGALD
jgi:hypothetical protein